jgi:hypothetical protein
MGNYYYDALDSWSTSRSILPITPYEIWQYEKYGNFYKEKDHEPQTDVDQMQVLQIKIYNNN